MKIDAPGGKQMLVYRGSTAAAAVAYLGWPDWDVMHFLRSVLRPGDGFIDVGANVGVYTLLAASCVTRRGHLIAIEADGTNVERLLENLALNNVRCHVHDVAVGPERGQVQFETGADTVGAVSTTGGGESLEMYRLDDLVDPAFPWAVGKMDIEGYELSALKGAKQLLAAKRPRVWILETNETSTKYGETRAELQAFLAEYGYTLYAIADEGRRLTRIREGGPFPEDSIAVADVDWLRTRIPDLFLGL